MNILYFDTETTGLPKASKPYDHPDQPRITQLGFIHEVNGKDAMVVDTLIKPENWPEVMDDKGKPTGRRISPIAEQLTGISEEMCEADGIPIADAMEMFIIAAENSDVIVCHNTAFDTKLIGFDYVRLQPGKSHRLPLCGRPTLCTMLAATPICKISKGDGRTDYKWPKLIEAMEFFFGEGLDGAHSAIVDIIATRRVFHKLGQMGAMDEPMRKVGLDPSTMTWLDIPTKADREALIVDLIVKSEFCMDYDPTVEEARVLVECLSNAGLIR